MNVASALIAAALIFTGIAAEARPAPPAAGAQPYKAITTKLNRQQLDGLLTYPDQVLLVDVRRPDEISAIGGFPAYLSVQARDIESGAVFIPRDRTLITVSNHAGRALKAADALLAKGFKVGGAIGAQDYEAEGGKLTKIVAPAPTIASAAK